MSARKPPPPLAPPAAPGHSGCFITGTDTNVGKTVVTAALARCLRNRRLSVGVMKPVETGVQPVGRLDADSERLRAAAGTADPFPLVAPYRFPDPLAPLAAARRAGATIELPSVMEAFRQLAARHRLMLVEGAGGVCAPLSEKFDGGDMILALGLPAVIVGRPTLGGVNHLLLTLQSLAARGVTVLAVVLNRSTSAQADAANPVGALQERSTMDLIRELVGVPVVGPVGHVAGLDEAWEEGIARLVSDPAIQALADLVVRSAQQEPSSPP